jgi:alpha-beta hydrolase superfamily lysophospholipase
VFTRSELVVLIRRGDHILGQIDIDSDVPNGWRANTPTSAIATPSQSFFEVNGVRLFTRRVGTGPLVVVLHGGPGAHHDYLLPQYDRLAQGRELFYYDQRGGGQSPVSRDTAVGWREHVADLDAIRDRLGLEQITICAIPGAGCSRCSTFSAS